MDNELMNQQPEEENEEAQAPAETEETVAEEAADKAEAVSYTHLTLPTMAVV